jgi:hypothetical protein
LKRVGYVKLLDGNISPFRQHLCLQRILEQNKQSSQVITDINNLIIFSCSFFTSFSFLSAGATLFAQPPGEDILEPEVVPDVTAASGMDVEEEVVREDE